MSAPPALREAAYRIVRAFARKHALRDPAVIEEHGPGDRVRIIATAPDGRQYSVTYEWENPAPRPRKFTRQPRWTDAQLAELRRRWAEGWTPAQIAARVYRTADAVQAQITRLKLRKDEK